MGQNPEAARIKILGIQARMSLVALHPELDEPPHPFDKNGKRKGWDWNEWNQVSDLHAPKLDACVARIAARPGCGHIVFCDNVVVHQWLRALLVEAGIDEKKIGILNAKAAGADRRQQIADAFNGSADLGLLPTIDIIIANKVAYEGVDLQRAGLGEEAGTCEIHHLDLPFNPSGLEQRNGRGVRQGNEIRVVRINYYLTQRSYDMARFQLIIGKRGWMVSLMDTLNTDTNNPGADVEMSPEELLIYLSRDPERTRALLEAQQARKVEAARIATIKESWRNLRALNLRMIEMRRETDAAKRASLETQIDAIATNLRQVDSAVWPWGFVVEAARAGRSFQFAANGEPGCLWEGGAHVALVPGTQRVDPTTSFVIGRLAPFQGSPSIGHRTFGSPVWTPLRISEVKEVFDRTQPQNWQVPWPEQEDRAALALDMQRRLEDVAIRGVAAYGELALGLAPEPWREWFWHTYGQMLVWALGRQRNDDVMVRVPVVVDGRLQVARGTALQHLQVLPFTAEGYQRFVELAPDSPVEYEVLAQAIRWWWNAVPPRNLKVRAEVPQAAAQGPQTQAASDQVQQAQQALDEGIAAAQRPGLVEAPRPAPVTPPPAAAPTRARPTLTEAMREAERRGTIPAGTVARTPEPPVAPISAAPAVPPALVVEDGGGRFSMLEVDDDRPVPPDDSKGGRFSMLDIDDEPPPKGMTAFSVPYRRPAIDQGWTDIAKGMAGESTTPLDWLRRRLRGEAGPRSRKEVA